MANFIKGNQSHVLFTTTALVELVPGYVWSSEVLCYPHVRHSMGELVVIRNLAPATSSGG